MSLRETAKAAILQEVSQAERYSHQRNYQRLHVRRDGTVSWFESINKSDNLIDRRTAASMQAKGCHAIESVHVTGTGSCACNCDYCNEVYDPGAEVLAQEQGRPYDRSAKYETYDEAINAALGDSDLSGIEASMLEAFEAIPAGYFNDEEEKND